MMSSDDETKAAAVAASSAAANQLAESEAQHRAIIESATDYAIFTLDLNGIIINWSKGAQRTFGFTPGEIIGKDSALLWPPEDRHSAPALERRIAAEKEKADDNRWHISKDGRRFYVRGALRAIRNASGMLSGFVKICHDETDRLHVEMELADARMRLDATLKAAEIATWVWDIKRDVVQADRNLTALYGLTPADGDGRPIAFFAEVVHGDDRPRVMAVVSDSLRTGNDYSAEYRIVTSAGQRWVSARGRVERNASGQPAHLSGVVIDISERKRIEESLRESEARSADIMRTSLDCIVSMDHRGNVLTWNSAAVATFGYSEAEAIGRQMAKLIIPPRMRDAHHAGLAKYLATGQGGILGRRIEIDAMTKSGVEIPVELTVIPATLADPPTFTAFIRDIRRRREAESERESLLESERAARAESDRASRMKDEFLATLSHELRTPLNAILGWSQIMQRSDCDSDDLAQGVKVIERNARAQSQIIEDLLDMSRMISGKMRLDVQPLDLPAALESAIETARPAANAKGVRLQSLIDPLAGIFVSGDANRLQQVFWNLLSNAVKFTPKNGCVQVLLKSVDSHLEISFADTGEGIPPEFLPYVFDRFRQADASTARRHGGLGLGLSIVKQLVELHGGALSVKSAGVGQGATFTVRLPLIVVHQDEEGDAECNHRRATVDGAPTAESRMDLQDVRILVVDDEEDARNLVRRLLEDCDAIVTTAGSADEAVQLIDGQNFDVLVTDVGMPVQDGYTLIRRIRSAERTRGGNLPAIALTAYARAEDRIRAISAGFQMHVAKPVERAELITMVAGAAGRIRI